MKKDLHPTYYPNAKMICVCGVTHKIGSTVEEINVNVCSKCHPFYTGEEKIVDTRGRVEKYQKRAEKAKKPTAKKVRAKA